MLPLCLKMQRCEHKPSRLKWSKYLLCVQSAFNGTSLDFDFLCVWQSELGVHLPTPGKIVNNLSTTLLDWMCAVTAPLKPLLISFLRGVVLAYPWMLQCSSSWQLLCRDTREDAQLWHVRETDLFWLMQYRSCPKPPRLRDKCFHLKWRLEPAGPTINAWILLNSHHNWVVTHVQVCRWDG